MTDHPEPTSTGPEQPPTPTETEQLRDTVTALQAIVNRVREALATDAPTDKDERSTGRRANIWSQLDRVGRGITLSPSTAELLRNQVEAELRLGDQAHDRWRALEAAERYRQAAADTFQGRLAAIRQQTAEGLVAGFEELQQDAERYKADYLSACATIAAMHEAATGRTGLGPIRGVVEDVADMRVRAEQAESAIARTRRIAKEWRARADENPATAQVWASVANAVLTSTSTELRTDRPAPTATDTAELEKTARVLSALHRSAEETVTRVIDLYERWAKAGPPPAGVILARWWDARLVELHDAVADPLADQPVEQATESCPHCLGAPTHQLEAHIAEHHPHHTTED
ncbi:hypothetical protein [Streptomyces tagetis]|uniref:Uncharacterized protein n=1 Tax=Streptomyces tagetis TaxID=2820809 RepID=A0A940XFS3_9ACTN|nr:hypothetical protein [Streptomyces sp. RG38]MBQ0827674.1 hypothetical protein [Streptomyces sp. RG38]